jgi:hypothetical protein
MILAGNSFDRCRCRTEIVRVAQKKLDACTLYSVLCTVVAFPITMTDVLLSSPDPIPIPSLPCPALPWLVLSLLLT